MKKLTSILTYIFSVIDIIFITLYVSIGISVILNPYLIEEIINVNLINNKLETMSILIGSLTITFSLFFVVGLVLKLVFIKKLKNAKAKNELTVFNILMIIFGYFVVGLSSFLIPESEFKIQETKNIKNDLDVVARLKEIKSLYDLGLITESEYNNKKKEIIDRF